MIFKKKGIKRKFLPFFTRRTFTQSTSPYSYATYSGEVPISHFTIWIDHFSK